MTRRRQLSECYFVCENREQNVRVWREVRAEDVQGSCVRTDSVEIPAQQVMQCKQGWVEMLESDSQVDQRSVYTEMQTVLKYYQSV